jgi:hypothetical protein
MRVSKRLPMVAAIVFSLGWLFFSAAANSAAQSPDDSIAALALGPQWKQLSRRSEMIFTATVLASNTPAVAKQIPKLDPTAIDHIAPAQIEIRFQVDEPIAGVKRGQIVTIHEWSGAAARHRPLAPGDRILLFLYPPSRLGLTSPVAGARGVVPLDSTGRTLSANANFPDDRSPPQSPRTGQSAAAHCGSVLQLERAIRSARKD